MIHFIPESPDSVATDPYAEAVARLAGLRHALGVIEEVGGFKAEPQADAPDEPAAWPTAGDAAKRLADRLTARAAAGAEAGLEALAQCRDNGQPLNAEALRCLADELRAELSSIERVLSL